MVLGPPSSWTGTCTGLKCPSPCSQMCAGHSVPLPQAGERGNCCSGSSPAKGFLNSRKHLMSVWFCQIVALNKTKEKMRPYQGNQEDEDPDIKKIKKVNMKSFVLKGRRVG